MNIRQLIGEVSGKNIIDKGDKVRIIFFEGGKQRKTEGVIIDVNEKEMKINSSSPAKRIRIEDISEISKLN